MNRRRFLTGIAALPSCLHYGRVGSSTYRSITVSPMPALSLVPEPACIDINDGYFTLTSATQILADSYSIRIGEQLAGGLRAATGYALPVALGTEKGTQTIRLRRDGKFTTLGKEAYHLLVTPTWIEITASSTSGLFYSLQTLCQLFQPDIFPESTSDAVWTVPCVAIRDRPRFPWRGLMLDSGHDFQTVETVKRYIELMALYKFNIFHWHLTDLGIWPLEVRSYPKLIDPTTRGSGVKQGYYTQAEILDVVRFASERHITVVPEIDMPGHVTPVLLAYPEFNCPVPVEKKPWQYCIGNEAVYLFLDAIITEVCSLFPSEFIHVGGDECDFNRWSQCPRCQALKQREGLTNDEELQSYFMRRIAKMLYARRRRLMGWDEILKGGLPSNAAVMSWHDMVGGIAAVKAGHAAIMTPKSSCYFDYYPTAQSLQTVYQFEPVPADLSPTEAALILGAEGEMWSDNHPSMEEIERHVYPRAIALAEVLWSPKKKRDYSSFIVRLRAAERRLDRLGVHYFSYTQD